MSKTELKAENERMRQQITHLNSLLLQRNIRDLEDSQSRMTDGSIIATSQLNAMQRQMGELKD